MSAGERQDSTTTKKPTGPYDRDRLLRHMRAEAEKSTVGKDWLVCTGEKKGKPFEKPEKEKERLFVGKEHKFESTGDPELDELLSGVGSSATEEELEDLAGEH